MLTGENLSISTAVQKWAEGETKREKQGGVVNDI